MRAIFLSYRRDDAEGEAGRLFDDLTSEFGTDRVFMDVTGIEPGRDFRKVIDQNVASCGVLLAMMGKGWIDAKDDAGRRRLDDPADFVRLETASALRRDIPVIPVLVHGGRMPRSEQLPEDLKDLAYRNAVELTHARWDSDVQVLIKALQPHVSRAGEEPGATGTDMVLDRPSAKSTVRASEGIGGTSSAALTRPRKKIWRGIVVAALAAIVIAAGLVGMNDYKKAEEAKVSHAAAEAAAKQAAEDQRVAGEKKAAERAAEHQAASTATSPQTPLTLQQPSQATGNQEQANMLPPAPGNEVMRNRTGNSRQSSTHLRPAVPMASLASRSESSANSALRAHSAMNAPPSNAGLPKTVSPNNLSPDNASPNQRPSTIGSPSVAVDEPALEQLAHDLDLLSSRADSVNKSLTALRDSQRSQGMTLRGDVASSQARMQRYLDRAQSALSNHNAPDARKYLGLAETEVTSLEKFLGR